MELLAPCLRGLLALRLVPAFIVLHKAKVAQAGMQSAVIVENYPVHRGLPSLLQCGEALAMHASSLQSPPEAFDRRVVPTITFAAHG